MKNVIRAGVALALLAAIAAPALGQFTGGGFSYTTGQLPGTTTNDSASAGNVGQYIEALQTSATNFPATATYGDLGSLALTAGDWNVTMMLTASANGATVSTFLAGIGTATGNAGTGLSPGVNQANATPGPGVSGNVTVTVANYRVSLAGSTTHYCKVQAVFTVATPQYTGRCSARRVR